MPPKEKKSQEQGTTQPVPKEEDTVATAQNQPAQETEATQPTTPLAGPSAPQTTSSQPAQTSQQVQPAQTPPQQVAVKEKKKGGMCNTTTCCIASCIGCLLIIIALVLLAIFAAPTLSKWLNNAINPGVDIPEVSDVDTTGVQQEIDAVVEAEQQQTITISEDEFNALLKQLYEEETTEDLASFDMRTDFEQDTATFYFKLSEWMPWATIEIKNDENGELEMGAIKLGPMDISSYFGETLEQEFEFSDEGTSSSQELDLTSLFAEVLFRENASKVTIKEIYFYKDEMKAIVEAVSTEDTTLDTDTETTE